MVGAKVVCFLKKLSILPVRHHTLELTARGAKRATLGGQVAQKGGTTKFSECRPHCSKRKEKEEEQARESEEREEKRAEKQANFQLAQIEFLIGRVPPVK